MQAYNRFQESKIYAIRSPHTQDQYIGSTPRGLMDRFREHRNDWKQKQEGVKFKGKGVCSSGLIFDKGDAYIVLLEAYPCKSRQEMTLREAAHVAKEKNVINANEPGIGNGKKCYKCPDCGKKGVIKDFKMTHFSIF